jgi:DNA-binding NarL/FixJ family response regulator
VRDPLRILTVDDHPLVRNGVCLALQGQRDMQVVAEAANGQEAIEMFGKHYPDVTLMDLQMPVMSGTDAIIQIRRNHPAARFVVLTTYSGDAQAARALKAGASAYVLKDMLAKELIETIRVVSMGGRRIPQQIAQEVAEHMASEMLTDRELEVLRHVSEGQSNKAAGYNLRITEQTVKSHMKHILEKLRANDRAHAVMIAVKRGLFDS